MSKEDVKEMNSVFKAFLTFAAFCIPYLVMALPVIFAITSGVLWWLFLLPASIIVGFLTKGSVMVFTETLKEE